MRKIDSMRFIFVFCLLCVFNTLVFPTVQRSFQIAGQWGAYALDSSLVAIMAAIGDVTEEEVDDQLDDQEFISSGSAFLYHSFDLDNSKNKIPNQQHPLLFPFLEKSTPPPRRSRGLPRYNRG